MNDNIEGYHLSPPTPPTLPRKETDRAMLPSLFSVSFFGFESQARYRLCTESFTSSLEKLMNHREICRIIRPAGAIGWNRDGVSDSASRFHGLLRDRLRAVVSEQTFADKRTTPLSETPTD